MQKKSLIKQNILQFIDFKNISKYKFYQETGITRGILDQDNGISEENTTKFLAQYPEINAEWLLTGKGNMLKSEVKKVPTQEVLPANNHLLEQEKTFLQEKITFLEATLKDKEKYIKVLEENKALTEKNNALLEAQLKGKERALGQQESPYLISQQATTQPSLQPPAK